VLHLREHDGRGVASSLKALVEAVHGRVPERRRRSEHGNEECCARERTRDPVTHDSSYLQGLTALRT
jgi:hypothetical protein